MSARLLDRLAEAGSLRRIDVEFARLIARLDGRADETLALAAAAASLAVAEGHSCVSLDALGTLLGGGQREMSALPSTDALRAALAASRCVAAPSVVGAEPLVCDGSRLWLRRYFDYERRVAAGLALRAQALRGDVDLSVLRARLSRRPEIATDIDWQAVAVALGLRSRLCVIGGGPGTGKTTTVLALLQAVLEQAEARGQPLPRIRLAAPTGKAATRLGETIRARKASLDCSDAVRAAIREDETSTLHRLLGYSPHRGFRHGAANPLAADLVVVDEASMIDLPLMAHLLDALPSPCALVLLGDVDQLASVEAGHVLASIAAAGAPRNRYSADAAAHVHAATGFELPLRGDAQAPLGDAFVELRHSHRFDGFSGIGRLATAVREGEADIALQILGDADDGIEWRSGDAARIARAARERWSPRYAGIASAATPAEALERALAFRVLTAVREGPFGAVAINRIVDAAIGDGRAWYHGRLVIVTANDYRHGLFNGDVGIAFAAEDGRLDVWFAGDNGELRAFAPYSLPAHEAAYAMTVHKSQGSEFDAVAVVLPDAANRVLGRELLYTAITRARRRVELWGVEAVVRAAITRRIERWSGLVDLLLRDRGYGQEST